MRRGWKEHWDNVERRVWTGWGFAWFCLLLVWLLLFTVSVLVPGRENTVDLLIHRGLIEWMLLAHALTYATMWLRRHYLLREDEPQRPGRDRDR